MENRFMRHIKPEIPKFNAHYIRAKTPLQSGKTEADYQFDANECYFEAEGNGVLARM